MRRPGPTDDPRPERGAPRQVPTSDWPIEMVYHPEPDGLADPGEIVWAWVPYAEDPRRGKDRPMLVVGRHGSGSLRALMLSTKRPYGHVEEDWLALGSGGWDRGKRTSYLRLDRLYELDDHEIRREGAVLDRDRFDQAAQVLRDRYGWS